MVLGDMVAHLLPETLKGPGGAGEVDPGQARLGHDRIPDAGTLARQKVDHAGRQARLFQELHDEVVRVQRG